MSMERTQLIDRARLLMAKARGKSRDSEGTEEMDAAKIAELDRRTLLKGAAAATGAAALAPQDAVAQNKNAIADAAVVTESVTFKSGADTIKGFIARPKADGKQGSVILIPDIFGLSDYAKETAAQIAQSGVSAIAVDFYSRATEPVPQDFGMLRAYVGKYAPDTQIVQDGLAAIAFMSKKDYVSGKFGVTGFCMGGRITLLLAANSPAVVAASPYYGPVKSSGPTSLSAIDLTDKIKGAVQGHYGATDMNPKPDDVKEFYEKLKATNPHGEYFIYPGAGHAFHSYSRPSFNPEAAGTAWSRTLAFFGKHLK